MYKTLWLVFIKVEIKWPQVKHARKLNSFSWRLGWFFGFIVIFLLSDAFCTYKCYTYSESYGSKEHSGNLTLMSGVEIKTPGILSSLRTQTGPWSDTFSYGLEQCHEMSWMDIGLCLIFKGEIIFCTHSRRAAAAVSVFVKLNRNINKHAWRLLSTLTSYC